MNTETLSTAYVGMGSNLGDRCGNLILGLKGIVNSGFRLIRLSSIYETEPLDVLDQPWFLNMVAEVAANDFTPDRMLKLLLGIEEGMGRQRFEKGGPRNIDIDLLLFGNVAQESDFLTLPHPRLHQRRFVLEPLAELVPDGIHPVLGKTYREMLQALDDPSTVEVWRPGGQL